MPAGWVFDNALERIALTAEETNPSLSQTLLNGRTAINGGYLDLRGLPLTEFAVIANAAERAFRVAENAGAGTFHNPAFYPGFIEQFRQLLQMLRTELDERRAKEPTFSD
jgi:hypothetical protein